MEFIRYYTMVASNSLAKERGAFPGINGSRYDYSEANIAFLKAKNIKPWSAPKPLRAYTKNFGMPALDWKSLEKDVKKFGMRNSCQNTIQPTGAIATISGLEDAR
jgi:ribonucleoside-diphosphate reductase alpha chain